MNYLRIPSGGMPFEGDDLLFMQDALYGGILAIANALSSQDLGVFENYILSGCEIAHDGSGGSISPGWIVVEGKLVYFAGYDNPNWPYALEDSSLSLNISYDPAGNEVFADAISKDTYELRTAIYREFENAPIEIRLDNPKRLADVLKERVGREDYVRIGGTLDEASGLKGQYSFNKWGHFVSFKLQVDEWPDVGVHPVVDIPNEMAGLNPRSEIVTRSFYNGLALTNAQLQISNSAIELKVNDSGLGANQVTIEHVYWTFV